jgi:hypothetical protein
VNVQFLTLPDSNTNPNDPHTTPPHQTVISGLTDTPNDPLLQTPPTPLGVKSPPPESKQSISKYFGKSRKKAQAETNPEFLEPGISGADLTLPVFDGTSTNPHDHLIDLDTPSMETCPDVRVYFALVGSVITKDDLSPPKDHAERVRSDARLIRQGREYLKAARDRGEG